MSEAISDTGPSLHLREIGQTQSLGIFDRLWIPDLVAEELRTYSLDLTHLGLAKLDIAIVNVDRDDWVSILNEADQPIIHPADAQLFVVARHYEFRLLTLTDDLALRRRLEAHHALVTGTIGILVRAYSTGLLNRPELENAIDALFTMSTLHLSRGFRAYIQQLTAHLP